MHRRSLTALLIAGLLVLAGCTGTTGQGTTVAEPEPTDTPTATATPTPEPTPEPAVEPGEIDAEAISDDHVAALQSAESFRMSESSSIDVENESAMDGRLQGLFSSSKTARVDLDAERGVLVTTGGMVVQETTAFVDFEDGRTSIRSVGSEGNVTYDSYDAIHPTFESPVENKTGLAYGEQTVEEWLTTVEFSVVGVETVDGKAVTRLEANGVDDHGEMAVWNDSVYERIHTTMLIDEDGVVREIHHEQTSNLTGEPMEATMTVRWTDVGSTTVEEPDWLEEARTAGTTRTTAAETESSD